MSNYLHHFLLLIIITVMDNKHPQKYIDVQLHIHHKQDLPGVGTELILPIIQKADMIQILQ